MITLSKSIQEDDLLRWIYAQYACEACGWSSDPIQIGHMAHMNPTVPVRKSWNVRDIEIAFHRLFDAACHICDDGRRANLPPSEALG